MGQGQYDFYEIADDLSLPAAQGSEGKELLQHGEDG